jgi:hypothetical protein
VIKSRTLETHFCPHCSEEIYEKHTWYDIANKQDYHRDCGHPIEFPKQDITLSSDEYKQKPETRNYSIEAKPYQLDLLEEFFSTIQSCGSVGASRTLQIAIDGDGSARLKFKRTDKKIDICHPPKDTSNLDSDIIKCRGID